MNADKDMSRSRGLRGIECGISDCNARKRLECGGVYHKENTSQECSLYMGEYIVEKLVANYTENGSGILYKLVTVLDGAVTSKALAAAIITIARNRGKSGPGKDM